MSQLPEIPASAYTPEMNTLGAIPDIPVFEGEQVPVSRNALTPGTRPLHLLPLPGTEFPVLLETGAMRGFQTEASNCALEFLAFDYALWMNCCNLYTVCASAVASRRKELRDATLRHTTVLWKNSSVMRLCVKDTMPGTVPLIWARPVLADPPPMLQPSGICWTAPKRSRVVAASFGDYAAGLHRTQPRFPPAMRYVLMERWNDCTHLFIFGFGELTLTPADYIVIIGLGFDGMVPPLDARYQNAALGAELVRTLLGVPTHTRYAAQGYVSYEVVYRFWAKRIQTGLAAWRELPEDVRPAAPAYTREERDQAARLVGSYDWASLALAHLYHGLDVWTRGSGESNWQSLRPLEVWAYEYRIYLGGLGGDASADARRIPRYLAHRHHTFSSSEDPHYWRCYLNDRALADLLLTPWEGNAWEAYLARAVAEAFTWSKILLQGYWVDRYFLGERIYELQVATAQRRVPDAPPRHMCLLEGMTPEDLLEGYDGSPADIPLSAGNYASYFSTRLQARLPEVREYIQAEAEVEANAPAGPTGAVLGDVPFPPGMEVALDPPRGLGLAIIIPADLRQAPPPLCLLRDTRSYTRGLASPGHTSPGCILSSMRGIWRLGGCGGTSPASPAPLPDSRWRSIDSRLGWRWRGFHWISPRIRRMMMMAPRLMMHCHLHPLRQQLVAAGGNISRPSPF
ncbi:hypothetical protein JCGZ_20163 [Jatropha curcas]|uniref:Aminotransferase-like plant mobile domain-containing protein n=1 Tax=Jatropha curcas TaxID=180498 RepID=A0A067JUA9_JATCU|nr:hypothetical protein JCGZ_20163 [Jatropha curcas]